MGIKATCPNGHTLHVKDSLAGKTGICPHCRSRIQIPVGDNAPAADASPAQPPGGPGTPGTGNVAVAVPVAIPVATAAPTPVRPISTPGGNWYVNHPTAGQFGPAGWDMVQQWVAELRITADCHLLREGTQEWQAAGLYFPSLSSPVPLAGIPVAAGVPSVPGHVPMVAAVYDPGSHGQMPAIPMTAGPHVVEQVPTSVSAAYYTRRRAKNMPLLVVCVLLVLAVCGLTPVLIWVLTRP